MRQMQELLLIDMFRCHFKLLFNLVHVYDVQVGFHQSILILKTLGYSAMHSAFLTTVQRRSLVLATITLILLTGCGQKSPEA